MPWGDRTGPFGLGPRTGRGLGYCSGANTPGFMFPGGLRWGRGRRGGWGCWRWFAGLGRGWRGFWRRTFGAGFPSVDEAEILRQEAEILRRNLEAMEKRLSEIEQGK